MVETLLDAALSKGRELVLFPNADGMDDVFSSVKRFLRFVCQKRSPKLRSGLDWQKRDLRWCHTLVAICNESVDAHRVIHLIHRLRSGFGWEGKFLAIVGDNTERTKLLTLSLVGDREAAFRFDQLPGHAVLSFPVLLVDLLEAIRAMEEMSLEAWNNLLDQSSVGRLLEKFSEAEQVVQGSITYKNEIFREILDEVSKVDWLPLLLDPHKDIGLVNELIELYSPRDRPRPPEYCAFVEKIRQLLLRSAIIAKPRET